MKTIVFLALVAFVAATPTTRVAVSEKVIVLSEGIKDLFPHEQYSFFGQQWGPQGNVAQVAQYITYLFHQHQQLGYTPAQVSQYFMEQGYPQFVAQYLAQQYEAGLTKPYFQSPYMIFEFYFQQTIPQEVFQYILKELTHAYQQYQSLYSQNGYEHKFSGVPSFAQYVFQQVRYYKNALPYSTAKLAFEHLTQAQQYAQGALKFFVNGHVSEEVYHYVYQQLKEAVMYIEKLQTIPQTYESVHQYYVPYYVAQYYFQQVKQVYNYFQNVYQYIQQYQQLPLEFVQHIRFAYFAAQKAYQIYQTGPSTQTFFPKYEQYQYGFNYEHPSKEIFQQGQVYQYGYPSKQMYQQEQVYGQFYQYAQNLIRYVQQQVVNGHLPQEYATYIIQQLEQVPQYTHQTLGYEYAQQVQKYFQNVYEYIQQQVNIPQFVVEYLTKQIEYFFQMFQEGHQYYGQYYPRQGLGQFWFQRYFNKNYQYPSYYTNQYQYGPYRQNYGFYPQTSSHQYGSYTPYQYQYGPYQQYGYRYQPYQYASQYGYQNQETLPYTYSGIRAQIPTVAAY